mmetsp:Transcript_48241/g.144025  ORF Transcript_48241/g.144025 Transcript_48241/m.144025 type:complete len:316 (-) Transcript_48241:220-1167(-)
MAGERVLLDGAEGSHGGPQLAKVLRNPLHHSLGGYVRKVLCEAQCLLAGLNAQSLVQRNHNSPGVPRIHLDDACEHPRTAAELADHGDSAFVLRVRCVELEGDEVEAIVHRGVEEHVCGLQHCHALVTIQVLHADVHDGRLARPLEGLVGLLGQLLQVAKQRVRVLCAVVSTGGHILQENNLALVATVLPEELLEGPDLQAQPSEAVHPVVAADDRLPAVLGADAVCHLVDAVLARLPDEVLVGEDKMVGRDRASLALVLHLQQAALREVLLGTQQQRARGQEVPHVIEDLEGNQLAAEHAQQDLLAVREASDDL